MEDIVVIGAGIAGLACARKLHDAGLRVLLVEATQHVGGRIRGVKEREIALCPMSVHSEFVQLHIPPRQQRGSAPNAGELMGEGDYTFETGAEFIHGEKTILYELSRLHGTTARKLFTWSQGDGGPSEEPMPDGGIGYYWLGAGDERKLLRWDDPDPEFVALHEALWAMGEEEGGKLAADGRYAESVRDYLAKVGTPPRMMALADAGYANTAGFSVDEISPGHTIDCEAHWTANDGEHDYRTRMSDIAAAMAQGLRVVTSAPVQSVRRGGGRGGVEVELRPSGAQGSSARGKVLRARKVVLAVAVTVLQHDDITFSPPLPAQKLDAANRIELSPGCKVLLKFSARFWPADCHGALVCDCLRLCRSRSVLKPFSHPFIAPPPRALLHRYHLLGMLCARVLDGHGARRGARHACGRRVQRRGRW